MFSNDIHHMVFIGPPDERVMVAGLVPSSQAISEPSIKIGDWLKEVDGTDVSFDNLDSVSDFLDSFNPVRLIVRAAQSRWPTGLRSYKGGLPLFRCYLIPPLQIYIVY